MKNNETGVRVTTTPNMENGQNNSITSFENKITNQLNINVIKRDGLEKTKRQTHKRNPREYGYQRIYEDYNQDTGNSNYKDNNMGYEINSHREYEYYD